MREVRRQGLIRVITALSLVRLLVEPRRVSGELWTTVAEESNHWKPRNFSPEWSSLPSSRPTMAITDPALIRGMEHPAQFTLNFHTLAPVRS